MDSLKSLSPLCSSLLIGFYVPNHLQNANRSQNPTHLCAAWLPISCGMCMLLSMLRYFWNLHPFVSFSPCTQAHLRHHLPRISWYSCFLLIWHDWIVYFHFIWIEIRKSKPALHWLTLNQVQACVYARTYLLVSVCIWLFIQHFIEFIERSLGDIYKQHICSSIECLCLSKANSISFIRSLDLTSIVYVVFPVLLLLSFCIEARKKFSSWHFHVW